MFKPRLIFASVCLLSGVSFASAGSIFNAQGVLDGDIDPFIEGYLHWAAREGAESRAS